MSLAKIDPEMSDEDVTLEYLAEHIWIVGDVDEVTHKLQKLQQDVGGFGTMLVIAHEWEPREGWLQSMKLLEEQVAPACMS